MSTPYTLKELGPEEAANITKELQEVLAKYDCEIGITSTMNIMKRQADEAEQPAPVLSPIQDLNDNGDGNTENNSTSTAA